MPWSPRDLLPFALHGARLLSPDGLLRSRPALAAALRGCRPLREILERRVDAALGPEVNARAAAEAYCGRLADLATLSLVTLRSGFAGSAAARLFVTGDAAARVLDALSLGRGVVLVGPHLLCHELMAAAIHPLAPVTFIVRHASRPAQERVKQAWYRGLGVDVVYRPQSRGGTGAAMREMAAAVGALRRNRVLALTPDLLQQPGRGVPVSLWGRTVRLPAGAAVLAGRTGAPLLPSYTVPEGDGYRLVVEAPIPVGDVRRDAAEPARVMQEWADRFDRFLRCHPEMWLFWLDKRWGAWLAEPVAQTFGCPLGAAGPGVEAA